MMKRITSWRPCKAMFLAVFLVLAVSALAARPALAADTPAQCAAIGDNSQRLACYDRAVGRAVISSVPPAPAEASAELGATGNDGIKTAGIAATPARAPSPLSKVWELDAADKRGTFKLLPYKANYVLPLRTTTSANTMPSSPGVENGLNTPLPAVSYTHLTLPTSDLV